MISAQSLSSQVIVSLSSIDPQRSPGNEAEQKYFPRLGVLGSGLDLQWTSEGTGRTDQGKGMEPVSISVLPLGSCVVLDKPRTVFEFQFSHP